MTNAKIISTVLSIGEHFLLLASLLSSYIFYNMTKILKNTICTYRAKVRDLLAEINELEKGSNGHNS